MVYLNPIILDWVALNINGLYTAIKRQGHPQWPKQLNLAILYLQQSLKDLAMLTSREILVKNIIRVSLRNMKNIIIKR